jgi:RNA polymerase sigma-70 factor (ECF subfamily)
MRRLHKQEQMQDITQLLNQWREGSREAEDELFKVVLPNLRRLARFLLKGERQEHSLQATELIDQVYFVLVRERDRDWQNRAHFFAIAARAMRRHLIDHARAWPERKFVALDGVEEFLSAETQKIELAITVDRLLNQLVAVHPDWCRLVEVKFFLGLTDEEATEVLGMRLRTMQRMWSDARQWLFAHKEAASVKQSSAG